MDQDIQPVLDNQHQPNNIFLMDDDIILLVLKNIKIKIQHKDRACLIELDFSKIIQIDMCLSKLSFK